MFKDYFSQDSENYQKFRPSYPSALFEYLASLTKIRDLAWDCATGNGQAALGLSSYFHRVMASDASLEQISKAPAAHHLFYYVALAEASALASQTMDLVTVAQAIHWFDFENFYREVKRVLKPEGLLAIWSYTRLKTQHTGLNDLIKTFYWEIVGPYWAPERAYIDADYQTIPFPFHEMTTPKFSIEIQWRLQDILAYIHTWSAVHYYEKINHHNPINEWLLPKAIAIMPLETFISIQMPLVLRVGKNIS